MLTRKHRFIFRPLEQFSMQQIGSLETLRLDIDDTLATEHKPGYASQVRAFLYHERREALLTLSQQAIHAQEVCSRMVRPDSRSARSLDSLGL